MSTLVKKQLGKTQIFLAFSKFFVPLTILYAGLSWIALQNRNQQEPQLLPVLARIQVDDQIVNLEVPQTPQQQAKWLMYRTIVARTRGILFVFEPAQTANLSMRNIPVPLDLMFLQNGQIEAILADVPPCNAEPCPIYRSRQAVDRMIGLRAGRAAELGLKVGDRLPLEFFDPVERMWRS